MCYQPIVEPGVNKFHNLSINSNHVVGVEGLSNHVWKTTYEYKARLILGQHPVHTGAITIKQVKFLSISPWPSLSMHLVTPGKLNVT